MKHKRSTRPFRNAFTWVQLALIAMSQAGCLTADKPESVPDNAIVVGAALPFSGPLASTGIDLERALMLAIEDVNNAGGVGGHQLYLKVRDSNSGTDRGLDEIIQLLRDDDVGYLIGPEEDHLALDVVKEVKEQDKMHILPSFSSPRITDSGNRGAWVRLVPSALTMGCALATKVIEDGVKTTRTIAARDDYHLEFSSVFSSSLSRLGGRAMPTVTVAEGQSSYSKAIKQTATFDDAEATVMLAYPATAASIVGEMSRSKKVRWYFSPMLEDQALLWNVPQGLLADSAGISPSLSNNAECDVQQEDLNATQGDVQELVQNDEITTTVSCKPSTANHFAKYFAKRWDGNRPVKSAHFYYDAIIMLALALEAAATDGLDNPKPQELLPYMIAVPSAADDTVTWDELDKALKLTKDGKAIHYVGAAGEYEFNERGQNIRAIVNTWRVDEDRFVDSQSVLCRIPIVHD